MDVMGEEDSEIGDLGEGLVDGGDPVETSFQQFPPRRRSARRSTITSGRRSQRGRGGGRPRVSGSDSRGASGQGRNRVGRPRLQ